VFRKVHLGIFNEFAPRSFIFEDPEFLKEALTISNRQFLWHTLSRRRLLALKVYEKEF